MIAETLIAVLVIAAIGAGLAAVLVISELFLANYGECAITINKEKEFKTEGGKSLLSALSEEKIFIPSACGGKGTCGLCKLKILEGGGLLLPTEEPFLEKEERENNTRLSCQVKVRNDLEIEIPEELFAIKEYRAKVAEIRDLTYDIKRFRFELVEPQELKYVPGQYLQLLAPKYEKSDEEVYRAYSISSDPSEKGAVETIIRLVPGGICTTYCFEYLKEGDDVKFNGPYGEFRLSDTDAEIIFIAGGSGMAPIKCILHQMKNEQIKRKATYFFGANALKDFFMADEMRQFEKELPDFRYVPALAKPDDSDDWDGETGLVTDVVKRNVKNAEGSEAYLCGSPGMIDAAIKVLNELGVTEDRIFYDKFA